MPDAKISELPLATALGDTDIAPLVQISGATSTTRRASIAQLRNAVLAERGAHVRDYGAKGDGTTDDGPAIQAAVNDLKAKGGGTLFFGPRVYRIASAVVLDGATVRLQGAGFTEGPGPGQGTWLRITTTGFTPFTFTGVNSRGAGIRDIAVQQTHAAAQVGGWAPTNYDFVFRVTDCLGGIDFDNVFLSNVNRGIHCRNSGRLDVRRLRGQILTTGIEIDECLDIPRIHSVHFWTFWTSSLPILAWQQANADAMVFRRCDGVFIDQAFVLGYRSMFRFAASAAGVTTKFYIGQAYADFVQYGVWVEASGTDGQIANFTSQNEIFGAAAVPLAGSSAIRVDSSKTRVQVGNLRVDAVEDNPVRINGTGNRLDVFALRCLRFNTRGNGAAAIHIADSGAATANAVHLGSPAILEPGNGGLLVNGGTNGILATGAPAGRAARPGLSLGSVDTGLFLAATGSLAGSAGGAEVLRATAGGGVTLGAAPGGHALEVATPVGTVNRLLMTGGVTGAPVTALAQGADAHVSVQLGTKGSGTVALQANGATALEAGNPVAAVNWVRAEGGAAGASVAVSAMGSDTAIGLAMVPKGGGPLAAAVADNAVAGGNPRGANAVDWQTLRSASTQVASGSSATVGGGRNNTAQSSSATIGGGDSNTASGIGATVSGGRGNSANGLDSWAPGGFGANARGVHGRGAWAAGSFAGSGDAQSGEFVLRRQTTDATPAVLTTDSGPPGAANQVVLPNNSVFGLRILVVARDSGGTGKGMWDIVAMARRDGGASSVNVSSTAASNAVAPFLAAGVASGWTVQLSADLPNGGIAINVTGAADRTIRWVARVLSVEVVS
jgi:hypothetical protein